MRRRTRWRLADGIWPPALSEGPAVSQRRVVARRERAPLTCVPSIRLNRGPADPGNCGLKVQRRCDGGFARCLRPTGDLEQRVNFQGVVVNVAELQRSIDFYHEVLGFALLSQKEQLAAMSAPGNDPPQVIVLREFGSGPVAGARHVGVRALVLEVDSAEELERITSELDSRKLPVSRRDHPEWTAVVGRDPDGVAVVIARHAAGGRITEDSWKTLDDFLYGIGE